MTKVYKYVKSLNGTVKLLLKTSNLYSRGFRDVTTESFVLISGLETGNTMCYTDVERIVECFLSLKGRLTE